MAQSISNKMFCGKERKSWDTVQNQKLMSDIFVPKMPFTTIAESNDVVQQHKNN